MRFFATCPRGLEPLLAEDAAAAGGSGIAAVPGGVSCDGDWSVCYRLNLESRIATRVLVRVGHGPYASEDDVYRLAHGVAWGEWFVPEQTIRVAMTAIGCRLKSLEFVTLRIKDGVCDRFRADCGRRPSVDTREADVRIHAFLDADECTLYVDTSGAPLYQRGLRQKTVEAPLKENLAAGLLRLAGWQTGTPLFDPMCGSGTILIEAAQIAHRIAPGRRRSFAFEWLRPFQGAAWDELRQAAAARELPVAAAGIFGSDSDPQAYRAALANLDRAGLLAAVDLTVGDILERDAPVGPGILLCNPPYGVRISELDELAAFYPRFGAVLKRSYAGWTCGVLSADTRLPQLLGLKPRRRIPIFNGALECRLYVFEMVAGSNRRPDRAAATPP